MNDFYRVRVLHESVTGAVVAGPIVAFDLTRNEALDLIRCRPTDLTMERQPPTTCHACGRTLVDCPEIEVA